MGLATLRAAGLASRLDLRPMPSNMLPKPSSSELSSERSESKSLGGVAVLALLAVMALPLESPILAGRIAGTGDPVGDESWC
jgi:hypothetical protein